MACATLEINVRVRWWVMPYLYTLLFFCRAFRVEPDVEKVGALIGRYGLKVH